MSRIMHDDIGKVAGTKVLASTRGTNLACNLSVQGTIVD